MPKGYMRMHISNRIALWRERRGFSQIQLARLLRRSPNTISHWENGHADVPPLMRRLLARLLHTSEAELFPD